MQWSPSPAAESPAVFSPRDMGRFSGALWAMGAAIGVAGCLLPHGPHVVVAGWWALSGLGAAVAVATWIQGANLPLPLQYVQSAASCGAVSAAVVCAYGDPMLYAVCVLYLITTVYAAAFYSRRLLVIYLTGQTAASGVVLLASGEPGAPAAWVVISAMAVTVGLVVHLLMQALVRTAQSDPLTGLPNRRAIEQVARRELARAGRRAEPLCLAVLDLDGFKEVNDRQGHEAGDRVLRRAAAAWSAQLRAGDVLGRIGGDEFVLLLPATEPADAVHVVERLAASDPQRFSAGLTVASGPADLDHVIRRSDAACYGAKRRRQLVVVEHLPAPSV